MPAREIIPRSLITCGLLLVCVSARAQDTLIVVEAKDPTTAQLFSVLLAGGGHIYAGETNTGLLLLGTAAGGLAVGSYLTHRSAMEASCSEQTIYYCEDETDYMPLIVGGVAAFAAWIYGIYDSDDAVRRYNHDLAFIPTRNGITVAWSL